MSLKDLPAETRPREKLLARGPVALADAELLARTQHFTGVHIRRTMLCSPYLAERGLL
jgi:DNA repair protein RadC